MAADFDKDGFIDLAVPSRDGGQSRIYFNDGKAGFARTMPFGPPDAAARAAAAADFNGDGSLDLVVGDEAASDYGGVPQRRQGQARRRIPGRRQGEDALRYRRRRSERRSPPRTSSSVHIRPARRVLQRRHRTQFSAVAFGDKNGSAYGFALGDINEDGFPDIALARSGAPNVLYLSGK